MDDLLYFIAFYFMHLLKRAKCVVILVMHTETLLCCDLCSAYMLCLNRKYSVSSEGHLNLQVTSLTTSVINTTII